MDAVDLHAESARFRKHLNCVFSGPLSTKPDAIKASYIGTWSGDEGRSIWETLQWEPDEEQKPDKVLKKFETYCEPRKNRRMARHRLWQRRQKQDEAFENFLKDIRLLIKDCSYTNPDDILVDVIIAGVFEETVQERLFDKEDALTLAQAIHVAQQYE